MTYDDVFDRLIDHEGSYINDPSDPGGETRYGISKRSYPNLDIKALTREDARAIYKRDFWDRIRGDLIISRGYDGVAFQLFDFAVNSGIETAIRAMQRAVGVADDGHWGPASSTAAVGHTEAQLIMLLAAERLSFMTRLKNWQHHGKGWARRIAANLRHGAEDSE